MSVEINLNKSKTERIINVVLFELIAFVLVVPLFSWLFGKPMTQIGVVAVYSTLLATAINFVFNLYFDKQVAQIIAKYQTDKTLPNSEQHMIVRFLRSNGRVTLLRTVLFQLTMIVFFVPFIMWILDFTILQSLAYNVSGTLFFSVYFYVFNYGFDWIALKVKQS